VENRYLVDLVQMAWFASGSSTNSPINNSSFDISVEFNEDDLNDPDLLRELAGLTMADEEAIIVKKPKPVKEAEPEAALEIDAILASLPPETDDEVQVQLTEEDMNDPGLLAELAAVGGQELVIEEMESAPIKEAAEPVKVAADVTLPPSLQPATVSIVADDGTIETKLQSTNIVALQQYIQVEKVKALNKKRAGG
jgi:hypothetical protein